MICLQCVLSRCETLVYCLCECHRPLEAGFTVKVWINGEELEFRHGLPPGTTQVVYPGTSGIASGCAVQVPVVEWP